MPTSKARLTKPPVFMVLVAGPSQTQARHERLQCHAGAFVVWTLESAIWVTKKPKPTRVQNLAETPASGRFQLGDGGPRGGEAPRGALRGGLGGQQGRQTEIDDHQRAALSCCGTGLPLCWGGPVRAALKQKEGKLRTGLCGPRGPVRPARLRGFRFAGSRPKTRGSLRQSETGSASVSRALDSELHGCT
jgi:hypothetical protein